MINQRDKSRHTGIFRVAPDREVHGNLSLDGPNTSLYLWDDTFFYIGPAAPNSITGILDNRKKVSLLECLVFGPGSYGLQGSISHYYNVFPHYVITGDQHVSDTDAKISNVYFLLDDATTLFHEEVDPIGWTAACRACFAFAWANFGRQFSTFMVLCIQHRWRRASG